jgi:four helix bundle protein
MKIDRLEDIECFRHARELTKAVYGAIDESPRLQKDLRLCGQMQSAAGAVMANIAQGFGRRSNKEFSEFLFIAMSSAAELQSYLYIAVDQGYLSQSSFDSIYGQTEKTSRIISELISYLSPKQTTQTN